MESRRFALGGQGAVLHEDFNGRLVPEKPETTASLELYLEPVEKSGSCREKSGGVFALLSLRFISHERRGPFRSLLRSFYSILTEEPRRVQNLVLVCYLDSPGWEG